MSRLDNQVVPIFGRESLGATLVVVGFDKVGGVA